MSRVVVAAKIPSPVALVPRIVKLYVVLPVSGFVDVEVTERLFENTYVEPVEY